MLLFSPNDLVLNLFFRPQIMKRILTIFTFLSLLLFACSSDDSKLTSVEGVWQLVAYNVPEGFDINNDGIKSINILQEIGCANNEVMVFESTGVVYTDASFNPLIQIYILNEVTNEYAFNVECDTEGVISLATNYTQKGNTITFNKHSASVMHNHLYIIYEDAIEIFNADFTKVLAREDLTLVYSKQ